MQLKGLVKVFTVLLIIISLYQLSFTYFVNKFEKKIKLQAQKEIEKETPSLVGSDKNAMVDIRTTELLEQNADQIVYKLPFTNGFSYRKAKENQLNLGLDLQGGMNVVLEVSLNQLILNLSNNSKDPALVTAVNSAVERKANSQANLIDLFVQEFETKNPNAKLASIFAKSGDATNGITFASTNKEVESYLRKKADDAINQTFNVLTKRIDKFGVAQPNISLDKERGIITVELAGVQNPERVRKFLQASAKLQFWEVFTNIEFLNENYEAFRDAVNSVIGAETTSSKIAKVDSTNQTNDTSKKDAGLGSLIQKKDTSKDVAKGKDVNQATEFDKIFSPNVPPQDAKQDEYRPEARIGFIASNDISKFKKLITYPSVSGVLPKNMLILFGNDIEGKNGQKFVEVYAIKTLMGREKAPLEGDRVTDAKNDFSPEGTPEVTMAMNELGAEEWSDLTAKNVGRPVAIALDSVVYSAPNVNERISGGRSSITMGGLDRAKSVQESKDLASILNSGKLDAPANIVQEQVVGPTLGAEAIKSGGKSFLISFVVIFLLMLIYYNTSGWVANIALILNLLFTVGILASMGATLTMPGIAGLVLTIGMAVDTNVLIFERIKDELRAGRDYATAVKEGYKRSMAPVLDAHVTTLITAIILFIFGLGPVLGFATTQIIGILLSLFCGILVSRMVTDMYMNKGKHFKYFTSISEKVFKGANFHFINFRKITYIISLFVVIGGIASFFNGFDYGVEFAGGRSYTVRFEQPLKTADVRSALKPYLKEYPVVKTIGNDKQLNITTAFEIEKSGEGVDKVVASALFEGLKKSGYLKNTQNVDDFLAKNVVLSQKVLPTISDDLKKGAVYATLLSLLAIFIYIIIRFRKWQYSVGTIFALIHDVAITLIVFSFFRRFVPFALEIDQHFIAAVLTVIGFSMNDTIIVFDRVREYFRKDPKGDKEQIINSAINSTLGRTVMTALTVFLTVLILFLVGGEVTKGFAFAMLIGIITGTYSSIFVAAPILVDLDKSNSLSKEEDREARIKELKKMA